MVIKKKLKTMNEVLEKATVPEDKQPYNLPEGWGWVKLEGLLDHLQYGYTESATHEKIGPHFLRITDLDEKINWEGVPFCKISKENFLKYKLNHNDIVVARMGSVGKSQIIKNPEDSVFASYLIRLVPNNLLLADYLALFMKTSLYWKQIEQNSKGTTRANVNTKGLKNLFIPLPPIAEQKNIIVKSNDLLIKIEHARKLIEDAKETFQLRRAAILEKAFNGELTSSWRKNNLYYAQKEFEQFHAERKLQIGSKQELKKYSFSNYSIENDLKRTGEFPDNWIELPVGFICECIVPGRDKPKSFSGDIPWITIPDIISETVCTSKSGLGLTEAEIKHVKAKIIPCNSVIMTCVGRFGISAVVQNPMVINQQLHAFLPNKIIDPKFLMYQIRTLEKYMQGIATSTTIAYLNKKNANSLPIKLPPIEEQKEIVIHLEKLLEKEESIFKMLPSKNDLEELKQSILSKAFKGELDTRDSKDKLAMESLKLILQEKLQF
ncbi:MULTISPECIES: restriction endonuclease subunit S [Bacillus]|uniref:restriction endonuclease subunit S n=1 Tax=Bacillus TaxID=1386 RepID=UPI0007783997|nr:restriction endonuclease subunit S [Bacillus toyonensis]KXY42473.1 hypothetical protein AT265_09215 [Bacillus cereus]PEE29887.1 hypothetical protein CON98_11925 [Bacillus toyonensis]HDR6255501.1 restriction endonuclease subunit S [Bacillus cereus]HDR8176919.1 restriction endonuclease subunit S [Bacillus cereus]